MSRKIYKILLPKEFILFRKSSFFNGNEKDIKSKFIHLSNETQVEEIRCKNYYKKDVFVLQINPECYGNFIKYELAKDNQIYPHLYKIPLTFSSVENFKYIRHFRWLD